MREGGGQVAEGGGVVGWFSGFLVLVYYFFSLIATIDGGGDRYMAVVLRGVGRFVYGTDIDSGREGDGEREAEAEKAEKEGGQGGEEWAYGRPVAVNRCMASVS